MNRLFPPLAQTSNDSFSKSLPLAQVLGQTQGLLAGTTAPRDGILVIACSDYLANPFDVVDERFEVCVLQNFGNLVEQSDDNVASPVEVSLALSKLSDILVLGHTPCVFLERVVLGRGDAPPGCSHLQDDALTRLRRLAHSRRKLGTKLSNRECAEQNVCLQLEKLALLPSVRQKLLVRELKLHGVVRIGQQLRWLRATTTPTDHSLAFGE